MHRILLEEGSKPTRESQRRLNPPMMKVVKKEIPKLLDVGVIYPILDSKWVSPVQVVPKKSGATVQTGWWVCVDYHKLNSTTRKDHFSFPFIDQMLERLDGHSHYCFLDGFSGYNQIAIALKTKRKQLSHAHLVLLHIDACHLVFAMHQLHSKGVWLAYFQIM